MVKGNYLTTLSAIALLWDFLIFTGFLGQGDLKDEFI